ncbi:MAG: chemotaxis protein CheB [Pseudomonadota bacterium]
MELSANRTSPVPPEHAPRAVLIYENAKHREPLVAAVAAAGATLGGELKLSEVSNQTIAEIDADVLVLNLEPLLDRQPDILEQILLGQGSRVLVMNDAGASAALDGSDRARWLRHLAAKISGSRRLLPPAPADLNPAARQPRRIPENFEVWLLAASIGGPEAVRAFFSHLDGDCPAALVLAQHIGAEFVDSLIDQLGQATALPVRHAREGGRLLPGEVLLVPVDRKITFNARGQIHLSEFTEEPAFSPCIDDVMDSLLASFGPRLHTIVFSGMARDGVAGAGRIRTQGGEIWVQDPASCVVASMVDGAMAQGPVAQCAEPPALAERLNQRWRQRKKDL